MVSSPVEMLYEPSVEERIMPRGTLSLTSLRRSVFRLPASCGMLTFIVSDILAPPFSMPEMEVLTSSVSALKEVVVPWSATDI